MSSGFGALGAGRTPWRREWRFWQMFTGAWSGWILRVGAFNANECVWNDGSSIQHNTRSTSKRNEQHSLHSCYQRKFSVRNFRVTDIQELFIHHSSIHHSSIHHSSYTTHHTPLIIHHSSYTSHHPVSSSFKSSSSS